MCLEIEILPQTEVWLLFTEGSSLYIGVTSAPKLPFKAMFLVKKIA